METRSVNFPCRLELYGHGDLVAHNSQELAAYQGMGWVPRPDTPPNYELYPMWLKGDGLPDLLVEDEAQARIAADRGYHLPSDDVIEDGEAAFGQAYEPEDEDYEPAEYPKYLAHPDFVAETLGRWTYDRGPGGLAEGRFIPGKPAKFASVLVNGPDEEAEWVAKGWTIGAEPLRGAVAHETRDPGETTSEAEKRATAPPPANSAPVKRKLSGAARRKLAREQAEREMSP
jgi:hypothetical protein